MLDRWSLCRAASFHVTHRSVRGLTLRLVDPELTPPSQGRQAVAVTLPLLLEKGGWTDALVKTSG